MILPREEELLRSVALQDAQSILLARREVEEQLILVQEELRSSRERLQAALSAANTGTFRWDIPSDALDWDENLDRLFGLGPGQTVRSLDRFLALVDPGDRLAVAEACARSAKEGVEFDQEFRILWADGSVHWFGSKGRITRDQNGRPAYLTGACIEVTAKRLADEMLRQSEQFNRTIIQSSRDCIQTLSLDGEILWTSESGCRAMDPDAPNSLIGRAWVELWQGEQIDAARRAVGAAATGRTGAFLGCLQLSARTRWYDVLVTPIRGAGGEPQTLLAISREVTERVEVERALREETRVLELLNQSGTILASQLDMRTLLQSVTDAATELSGARAGAFLSELQDQDSRASEPITLSGEEGEAFERLSQLRSTDLLAPIFRGEGTIRSNDLLTEPRYGQLPLQDTQGRPALLRSYLAVPVIARSGAVLGGLFFGHPEVGFFSDKTERILCGIAAQAGIAIDNARLYEAARQSSEERKQLLENERLARVQAERMSAMKDEFLAVLSHELRTPLSAILGWSQLLRRRVHGDDVMARSLEVIERNARVQTQLIEDLLDMSRIASGKIRLDLQSLMPMGFIESAIETVRPTAMAKGILLEALLEPDAGPVHGDPGRLQQVVWNLLSNAIKFTPKGGKVQVFLERLDSQVEIRVADTGVGISSEFVEHVFERFRQADASTTRKHGGLGLGLSIVKHLVELHGGTVAVKGGGEGFGATFILKLPLGTIDLRQEVAEPAQPRDASAPTPRFDTVNLRGKKILVIDDEPDTRAVIAQILTECGAEVHSAASAGEALNLIEEQRPEVLVSDIGMPGVDGFELLERVRALGEERGGKLPAIALTAFARSEDRTRALRAGFLTHLAKPVDPTELVTAVAKLVGRVDPPTTPRVLPDP